MTKKTKKTKKIKMLKKYTSLKETKKIYKKVNNKKINKYKKICNDNSFFIGNWCVNQNIRKYLIDNNKNNEIVSPEKIYEIRDDFLKNNINSIFRYIKQYTKNNKISKNIKIFPTGSSKITSDKDVQITLNLYYKFTLTDLKNITNSIIKIRKDNQKNFFDNNKKKIFDTYFDINYYMPSLFYFLNIPVSKTNFINNVKQFCYIKKTSNNPFKASVVLKPNFDQPMRFLNQDCRNILKNYNMNLKHCYERYKNKPAEGLANIINNIHSNKPFNINSYLFDITSINNICAEMYMSICTTIYVVWYMQMNNSEIMSPQFEKDLKYLAIPTVIENQIHYVETKKEKYLLRKQHALKNADKALLTAILKSLVINKSDKYSKSKINILKKLLKEIH
jgi:hypothetical protein